MAFSVKAWLDRFGSGGDYDQPTDTGDTPDTPLDAAGMRDLETRLSGYTDSQVSSEATARNTAISSHASTETTARNAAIASAISAQGDLATQAELDAHTADATAAHAASAIGFSATGTISSTDVQAAVAEVATDAASSLSTHLADSSDVHAASAITVTPFSTIASTNVQDALAEIVAEAGGSGSQPALTSTGTTGNFGTTLTVDFGSTAREKRYSGVLNGNLAVTVQNPVAGSMLVIEGAQDGTGGRTLTVAGQSVTVPSAASAPVSVEVRWYDASTFRVVSAGVETDATATTAINNHIADTTAAHAAGSISYAGGTGMSATDVEAAIDELATEKTDKATLTTKGDLYVATGAGTVVRIGVGSNDQVLTADSAQTPGVKWATPSGGGSGGYYGLPMSAGKRYITPQTLGANWSQGNGRATAVPFMVMRACTVTEVSVQVTIVGSSGTVVRIGITADAGGYPGNLIAGTSTLAVTSGTDVKTIAISAALTPGVIYWYLVTQQAASAGNVSLMGASQGAFNPLLPIGTDTFSGATGYLRDHSDYLTGALPATNGSSGDWFYTAPAPTVGLLAAA